MDKKIRAGIDHCTILNKIISTSANVFFPIGFAGDGNSRTLTEAVSSAFVPSVRFVFDNAYLECAQFPTELEEFYHYLKSDAGIYMLTLLTDSAERFRSELLARGDSIPDIVVTERENADHGVAKGTAIFRLVEIPGGAIPDTHVAFLEHKTRNLIYQPSRYRHPNTADTFEQLVLCTGDEKYADCIGADLESLCGIAHSEDCRDGLRDLRIVDPATFAAEFGYPADEERSIFSALVFGVSDMAKCRKYVDDSGFRWHEDDGTIYLDTVKELSLVLCFRERSL